MWFSAGSRSPFTALFRNLNLFRTCFESSPTDGHWEATSDSRRASTPPGGGFVPASGTFHGIPNSLDAPMLLAELHAPLRFRQLPPLPGDRQMVLDCGGPRFHPVGRLYWSKIPTKFAGVRALSALPSGVLPSLFRRTLVVCSLTFVPSFKTWPPSSCQSLLVS